MEQVKPDLQVVQDDAGAEEVVVDADEVRQLRVQHYADALLPQSQSLFLCTHTHTHRRVTSAQLISRTKSVSTSYLQDILSLVPLVGPLLGQLQHLRTHTKHTSEQKRGVRSLKDVFEFWGHDWKAAAADSGLTLASFWCSFSSILRAVGESRRAI